MSFGKVVGGFVQKVKQSVTDSRTCQTGLCLVLFAVSRWLLSAKRQGILYQGAAEQPE